jgi:hypothetical protein
VPGLFTGDIGTTSGTPVVEDGQLQLSHGQVVTATYHDANDSNGQPAVSTDTATADCEGPVVSAITLDIPGPQPVVMFETDEPATVRLLYSQTCGDPDPCVAARYKLEMNHSAIFSDVQQYTQYFFFIEATDALGNLTVDDNTGQCYTFTTNGPTDVYVPAEYPTIQASRFLFLQR